MVQDDVDTLRKENVLLNKQIERMEREQRVLRFGIENYPSMWLGNWPKLRESVVDKLREYELRRDDGEGG